MFQFGISKEKSWFNDECEGGIRHESEPTFRAINVGCMCSYMDYEPRCLKELLEMSGIHE